LLPPKPSVAAAVAAIDAATVVASHPLPVRDGTLPYVAAGRVGHLDGKWRERYAGVCDSCFDARVPCAHYPELPLRCLLLGHNPSEVAFTTGWTYGNPTNRMWTLLQEAAHIVPPGAPLQFQNVMPAATGVGFTDLGVLPGNDAGAIPAATLAQWRRELYASLAGHARRAAATRAALSARAAAAAGVAAGSKRAQGGGALAGTEPDVAAMATVDATLARDVLAALPSGTGGAGDGAPRIVAFTGKAHWKCLFTPPLPYVAPAATLHC